MTKIDEWNPVLPQMGEPSSDLKDLVGAIYRQLMSMEPQAPDAVHFYRGEGLRWIRVGFGGAKLLKTSAVANVGRMIETCIPKEQGPLFFNALRPYDLLFFLEGDGQKKESIGMPPTYFGAPLKEVLHAWGSKPSAASRKTPNRAQRRVS
jgi:hypothetical protein